ncbi:MAG: retropepsin-like aspartic protease [bacterium]|nr:retropepsin-like aspartic protease [bacterium]
MGKITEKITVTNFVDEVKVKEGLISEDRVRKAEVEAIIDSGATLLCLPKSTVEKLGLTFVNEMPANTANGKVLRKIYGVATLTIRDRSAQFDVMEVPEETPALVGQLPLERLDFQLDLKNQRLIPNPEHPDKLVLDLY